MFALSGQHKVAPRVADQESLDKEVHAFVATAFGNEPVRLKFGS